MRRLGVLLVGRRNAHQAAQSKPWQIFYMTSQVVDLRRSTPGLAAFLVNIDLDQDFQRRKGFGPLII